MQKMRSVLVFLILFAPIFIMPTQFVHAQYDESDCQYSGQMSFEGVFSRTSAEIVCLTPRSLQTINVLLHVGAGSVRLFYTQDINASFMPRGVFQPRSESYSFALTEVNGTPLDTPTLMVVPSENAQYGLVFEQERNLVTALPECDLSPNICPTDTPVLVYYPVELERVGDQTQFYVDVCPGEFQVMVDGVPERNDVYIHIYPLGGTVPGSGDAPNVTRASHLLRHSLVSWQPISNSQAQSNPVWVVYITRNGYDQSRVLRVSVSIEQLCGRTSVQDARPPQNAFRTRPGQGDTLLPGGVSVQNYCNYYNMVARTVNDQYWVCFHPFTMVSTTLEPVNFDTMCRQQHGRNDAYSVKPQPGPAGLECYR